MIVGRRVSEKNFFIRCDCGDELLEFRKDRDSFDDKVYWGLAYFACSYRKSDKDANWFYFKGHSSLVRLYNFVKEYQNKGVQAARRYGNPFSAHDKNILEVTYHRDGWLDFAFAKSLRKLRKNDCSWELILRPEHVSQFIRALWDFIKDYNPAKEGY